MDTKCSTPTTLEGKVFDPAGLNPLSGVVVFIPRYGLSSLAKITPGTNHCNTCDVTTFGDYVVATETRADGSFKLTGVPTGKGVPVTVQIGKWRRTIPVTITDDCTVNQVSMTPSSGPLLRLPRNKSEGDMSQMALLTGGCDGMACFLMNVGIEPSEFGAPHSGSRVDVYQGLGSAPSLSNGPAGGCTTSSCPLWSSEQALEYYDQVVLGCECSEHTETKPPSAIVAMHDWLTIGGQVFAVHSQETWFKSGPPDFQGIANWENGPAAGAPGPFVVGPSPAASAFSAWLSTVGAINPDSTLPLSSSDVSESVTGVNSPAVPWIVTSAGGSDAGTMSDAGEAGTFAAGVHAFSFGTPVGTEDGGTASDAGETLATPGCGSAVVTDIHVGTTSSPSGPVPSSCVVGNLTAEEKALEFLFFAGGCPLPSVAGTDAGTSPASSDSSAPTMGADP